jgi:hypothetical protein
LKLLLMAGAIAVGLALGGCTSQSSVVQHATPSATPSPETTPSSEAFIVPLETLATMSPEQITQLSTITVESVTVNGEIDWKLYAKKLNDILNLGLNAGATATEMNQAYNDGVDPGVYVSKYDPAFVAGFAAPGTDLGGYEEIHASNAVAAYKGNLLGAAATKSLSDLVDTIVVNPSQNGATLEVTVHNHNNFFSSGAFNADSKKDVTQAGTNADLDTIVHGRWTVEVRGTDIKLVKVG